LTKTAARGDLAVVSKNGEPLFLAIPFNDKLIEYGVPLGLACLLYSQGVLSLGKAAKFARLDKEDFIEKLGEFGAAAVNYPAEELVAEFSALIG
ncbi:MAG: UPF0175 family protein, partial [Lacisediminimonas sp.]|nr:UPF0175 family protein [Lacisediminimonas sp.]